MRSTPRLRNILSISRHFNQSVIKTRNMSSRTRKQIEDVVTPLQEARRFMIDCLEAVGTSKRHAEIVSDNLLAADNRGHYSHGMNRLELYIRDIQSKTCKPNAEVSIEKQTVATALCDGHNGLGAVVGKSCMEIAIQKASEAGIGFVTVHGSNHYGIAGMYVLQAMEKGYLGLSFTNTSPFMVPTAATKAALGTNPLALGAPATNGDSFVLDMATTAVAVGKIELQRRKGEPIPSGWALNEKGLVETDAEVAYKASRLMPLGGAQLNSGYKGYGLGMLVEIFCGILSGAAYGPKIRKWGTTDVEANLGQCFIAIDPACFAPGFAERMQDLMDSIRCMEPVDPQVTVKVAGDPERIHMQKVEQMGGLLYVQNQHDTNAKLAEELHVKPMQSC